MRLLFRFYACDHCDGVTEYDWHTGFVVLQPHLLNAGGPFYVFPTRTDAAVWRSANSLQRCAIREVRSLHPFEWTRSGGSLDLTLADGTFEVFPNHKHPPGQHRASLVPLRGCRPRMSTESLAT